MTEVAPLIGAKLLPPTPGRYHLPRPRLIERLDAGLSGRLTLVLAGPGYGKSTLLASFLKQREGDSVWYRVDSFDNDPWVLFRYLIHGVREHVPEFGERSEGVWQNLRSQPDAAERLADTFIRDAEEGLGGPIVVVLDGIQHLEPAGPCARALRRLIAYQPDTLHLALLGRSLPELGLAAPRADESVNLLQGEDLLFSPDETRRLLEEVFGLKVQPDSLRRIQDRTRGWVTALQLLRQTAHLEKETVHLPEEIFARTEPEIFDYFSEEVLASEPPDNRRFLLGSSLPLVVDPDVCAEVLSGIDVGAVLSGLARRSLFVSPLESRGEYYAWDPLFRDFLRRKLREEAGAERVRELHQSFAAAFTRKGEIGQALSHWIAADDMRRTIQALSRHGKALLRAGMLDTVREAALLAARRGARSAVVQDLLGETCRLAGDHAAAVAYFESALGIRHGQAPARDAAAPRGAARASTLQGLAYSLLKMGETQRAETTAEEALAHCGEDPALRARILNTLSIVRYREQRHTEALAGWQEALRCARQAGDEHLIRMIAHNMGLPHAVLGDFARASECFQILIGPDNPRLGPEEGAAYLNLARIETLRGDFSRASSLLVDAREIARKWQLTGLTADVLEAEGNLFRDSGDLDAARARYEQARALFGELGRPDLIEGLSEEEALLASLRGDHDEAARLASGCVRRRRETDDRHGLASSLLALGEARARAGEPAEAAPALEEASALFESLGCAYERCVALMWLGSARHRLKRLAPARRAVKEALELSAMFDYRGPVLRVTGADPAFARFVASMAGAPAWLETDAARRAGPSPAPAAQTLATEGPDLTIRLLGPVEVFRETRLKIPPQAWKIRRALQLVCYLAASRDHRATKDRIADALWGEVRPSVIEKNFHPTISFLRRALNHGHNVPKNFILFEGGAYRLNPAYTYDVDTDRFEERVREARRLAPRGETPSALAAYDAAIALYRGPFLEEEYDAWAEGPRAHFESLYLAALGEAGELHLKGGAADAALACLRRLVDHDPLDEEASCRLMQALGMLGDRAGVTREFDRLARVLEQELSTAPLPGTRRVCDEALTLAAKNVAGRDMTR